MRIVKRHTLSLLATVCACACACVCVCVCVCACAPKSSPTAEPEPDSVQAAPAWPEVTCTTLELQQPVPTFDPDADIVLTGGGGTRPDEYHLVRVFGCQHDFLDRCVNAEKAQMAANLPAADDSANATGAAAATPEATDASLAPNKKTPADDPAARIDTLRGDVEVAVLLNPEGQPPLGVNVALPEPYSERATLTECIQRATASAPYPTYDGPPFVVHFTFDLDPGYDDEPPLP